MWGVIFCVRLPRSSSTSIPCSAQLFCNIRVIVSITLVKTRKRVIKTKKKEVVLGLGMFKNFKLLEVTGQTRSDKG